MLGIVGNLITTANTGLDALQSFIRYQLAFGEGLRLDISEHIEAKYPKDTIVAKLWTPPAAKNKVTSKIIDSYFVALMNCVQLLTGNSNQLIQVNLQRPKPDVDEEYKRIFGCPVLFSQAEDELILSSKRLEEPLLSANPALHLLLKQQSQSLLLNSGNVQDFPNQVRHQIEKCIDGSKIDIDRIAQCLCISPRTLQRKLKATNKHFQHLLDEVRNEFAIAHLKGGAISIDEQAYLLGFSEPSVYRKSFKRWTGKTPSEFKRALVHQKST
jgi:AraC-like DNA-binding protein